MMNENKKIIFPEQTPKIIFDLIKKYKLEKIQKEIKKKIGEDKTADGWRKIALTLPSIQIIKILKETTKGEILPEEISSFLQKRLGISQEEADNLAQDLKERVLNLTTTAPSDVSEEISIPEKASKKETQFTPQEKEITSKKTDVYREPIE